MEGWGPKFADLYFDLFVAHYSKMVKPQTYGHLDWMHCWHQVIVPGGLANLGRCSQSPSPYVIIIIIVIIITTIIVTWPKPPYGKA